MDLLENFIKFSIEFILKRNIIDLKFIDMNYSKNLISNLQDIIQKKFIRITYTEAIDILLKASIDMKKNTFKNKIIWGINLSYEHEIYITDIYFKNSVFIYDYPKRLKNFQTKINNDEETISSFGLLLPKFGKIAGGSEKEFNKDIIEKSLNELFRENVKEKDKLNWYIDLKEFGSAPHSGFSLGFDRLVMFITGMMNIKDVIPYPRFSQHAEF
jgi:asparaginyl-tRNA synthetase